jgi:hypothetical protein
MIQLQGIDQEWVKIARNRGFGPASCSLLFCIILVLTQNHDMTSMYRTELIAVSVVYLMSSFKHYALALSRSSRTLLFRSSISSFHDASFMPVVKSYMRRFGATDPVSVRAGLRHGPRCPLQPRQWSKSSLRCRMRNDNVYYLRKLTLSFAIQSCCTCLIQFSSRASISPVQSRPYPAAI